MGEWTPFVLIEFEWEVLQLYIKYGHGEVKLYNTSFFVSSLTDETALMTLQEFAEKAVDCEGVLWSQKGEQQHITKSGFFKINPYQEYVYREPLESWFAAVEAALGFKLFFWQKSFIEMGVFRRYGESTAKILRELSKVNEPPLDLVKYKTRGHRERWFCEELLRIKNTLDAAGVPTREVLLTVRDEQEYLKRKAAEESRVPGQPGELEGLRAMGRFWDL